jgi:hypothetical protein
VAAVTVLRADVLAGLALAEDVGRDRHGCGGEVGGGKARESSRRRSPSVTLEWGFVDSTCGLRG